MRTIGCVRHVHVNRLWSLIRPIIGSRPHANTVVAAARLTRHTHTGSSRTVCNEGTRSNALGHSGFRAVT